MWVICLSAEQTANKELIQRLSRSLVQVCKERSVLLLRLPVEADGVCDFLETRARGRFLSSYLNEEGVAVISVEGTDKQTFQVDETGKVEAKLAWISKILGQGIVVSLSILASSETGIKSASLASVMKEFKKSGPSIEALILLNKSNKRRIFVGDEAVNSVNFGDSTLDSRVLDENIIHYLSGFSEFKVYITSPIALLSKELSMSTSIVYS